MRGKNAIDITILALDNFQKNSHPIKLKKTETYVPQC